MSVSIDKDPAGEGEEARAVLASWLDDYASGRCDRGDMQESFLSVCRSNPDAPWDALALLDQYQRRRRIDTELARSLKADIAQLVFGVANQTDPPRERPDDVAIDATGSRWRKLLAEDDPQSVNEPHTEDVPARPRPDPGDGMAARAAERAGAGVARETATEKKALGTVLEPAPGMAADRGGPVPPGVTAKPAREMRQSWTAAARTASEPTVADPDVLSNPPRPAVLRPGVSSVSGTAQLYARADDAGPGHAQTLRANDGPMRRPRIAQGAGGHAVADRHNDRHRKGLPVIDGAAADDPRPRHGAARTRCGPGDLLRDRYELLTVLGRGRSGTLYKALDRHRMHSSEAARYVAVKVLERDYDERPEELAKLERAFDEARSLTHPNIANVYDLDRDAGTYFVVMELLEGELLSDVLRRLEGRPMARKHAYAIIGAIGAALTHAHRRDIVHGDLEPRNVIITSRGEIRVLDFGFARNRPLELHSASALHEASAATTPAYASMERVNGSEPHVSDDAYSLACLAYQLLSGQHPYGGRSAVLARAHGRRPRRIADLTHKQSQVLQRALAWSRGERRPAVPELLDVLGCSTSPAEPLLPEQLVAQPRVSWRRRVIGMMLFVLLACVAAAFVYLEFELSAIPSSSLPSTMRGPESEELPTERALADEGGRAAARSSAEPLNRPAQSASAPLSASGPQGAPAPARAATPFSAGATAGSPGTSAGSSVEAPAVRTPRERVAAARAGSGGAGPAKIEFARDSYVATESDGSVSLTVRRSGSTREAVSFRWSLHGNSAEAGADFANIGPGVERMPPGVREATITVPLVSDAIIENTELFLVEIEPMQGAVLGERSSASVIIVDDD